ncbi:hypothetical protein DFA_08544 [Cavenderia fasciculata]|uniref:Purple acid phosphatase n=1 Tax=Cavenderia fasciculata TaxID=261658 RepID=F4Q2Y4_CACFS|nr:uncharacterized protein DFA_08544 [Cavenderia fasciculata]EGG17548.1 hypothetical protein DFA_08544 [Cavenderia fasciculata]|eukprot:XP_004356032.1 hypothetical protein DFA_08544 [Cavenderia fasciculata]
MMLRQSILLLLIVVTLFLSVSNARHSDNINDALGKHHKNKKDKYDDHDDRDDVIQIDGDGLEPLYVKLSLTENPGEMMVGWFTYNIMTAPQVQYKGDTKMATVNAHKIQQYKEKKWTGWSYSTLLTGLEPNTQYIYQVGDASSNGKWSNTFNFTTHGAPGTKVTPFSFIAYGDMGAGGADLITIGYVMEYIDQISFVLHVGDIAYADLHSTDNFLFGNQTVWNEFMGQIEPITSSVPYMTTPGNHDVFIDTSIYRKTFHMPTTTYSKSTWYGFDYNGVHFVSISSEQLYIPFSDQHDWLANHLAQFRQSNPNGWLIVYAHRPVYCSADYTWCKDDPIRYLFTESIEKLLYQYNVDVYISGHSHVYERSLPVFDKTIKGTYEDPKATVHIVVGTGGAQEAILSNWLPQPHWSSGVRISSAGYGMLSVLDNNQLNFEFYGDYNNTAMDSFFMNKGTFN